MFFHDPSNEGGIQEPVVHGLVSQGNAANVVPSVHVPRPYTHPQLLWNSEVTPSINYALLEGNRSYRGRGSDFSIHPSCNFGTGYALHHHYIAHPPNASLALRSARVL